MRYLGGVIRTISGELGSQFLVSAVVAGRNHDESLDVTADRMRVRERLQGVDEHVDTLVAIFVTASYSN